MIVITRKGAEYLLSHTLGDDDLVLRLFTACSVDLNYEAAVLSTYSEPNSSAGYAAITIGAAAWGTVQSPAGANVYREAANSGNPFRFTFNGTDPENEDPVIGYLVSQSTDVLWFEEFIAFQPTDSDGDYIDIKPRVEFS